MSKIIPILSSEIIKFPPKNLSGQICFEPFRTLTVRVDGSMAMCGCKNWMPTVIGNIFDLDVEFHDLLNSPLCEDIRQSILRGTYDYCDSTKCGVINNNQLISKDKIAPEQYQTLVDPKYFLQPVDIFLGIDRTCNLSCPSCRTRVIKVSKDKIAEQKEIGRYLQKKLFSIPSDREMQIRLSSSGEIFASHLLMEFVNAISLKDFPNLYLIIQTNGLLAQKNWHRLGDFQDRVRSITVTIDAAKPDTYEKLRRGGKWKNILRAMTWLQEKKRHNGMKLITRMVVQKDNYREMKEFYDLSKKFDSDLVEYARIGDWGVMSPAEFSAIDVFNPTHPEFNQTEHLIEEIKDLPDVMIYGGIDNS